MAVEIILYNLDSNEISTIVRDLKDKGYKTGIDFDFAYSTGRYDYNTDENIPRQTLFTIYNEKLATWLALKWS